MDPTKTAHDIGDWVRAGKERIAETAGSDSDPPEGLLETGAAIAAGVGTRMLLKSLWKRARGSEPPRNPAAPDTGWTDALLWAASVGAAIGVARVLARRGTAAAVDRRAT